MGGGYLNLDAPHMHQKEYLKLMSTDTYIRYFIVANVHKQTE